MEDTRNKYCLPTYGIPFPSPEAQASPSYLQYFRPVQYLEKKECQECQVSVTMCNYDLWRQFAEVGNEMVVTRSGR